MGFTLIKGTFHPELGLPDGDSVRFKPNNPQLLKKLEGTPAKITQNGGTKGTLQLRFEGIDAIEKGAQQPLSKNATDSMNKLVGGTGGQGYILARMTDPHGRPLSFVFAGTTPKPDGSDVFLDPAMLSSSVNYKQMQAGYAYPLYYNTLFASLRSKFNQALNQAKQNHKGYWPTDKTNKGVNINGKPSLKAIDPVWPKLWRRFEEYVRNHNSMNGFIAWLDAKNERILKLDSQDETGLANIVKVQGNKVWLTEKPENLMVITAIKRKPAHKAK